MNALANTDVVLEFIDKAYNRFDRNTIKQLVHPDCQFKYGMSSNVQSRVELQVHLAYLRLNKERLYDRLEYQIADIKQTQDIVAVLVVKRGRPAKVIAKHISEEWPIESKQWEMFHLKEGKIKARWTAEA